MTDSFLILHQGRLLADGSVLEIRELLEGRSQRVSLRCDNPRPLFSLLSRREDITSLVLGDDGQTLTIETRGPDGFHEKLLADINAAGVVLEGIHSPDENLEAVFETLVRRR